MLLDLLLVLVLQTLHASAGPPAVGHSSVCLGGMSLRRPATMELQRGRTLSSALVSSIGWITPTVCRDVACPATNVASLLATLVTWVLLGNCYWLCLWLRLGILMLLNAAHMAGRHFKSARADLDFAIVGTLGKEEPILVDCHALMLDVWLFSGKGSVCPVPAAFL